MRRLVFIVLISSLTVSCGLGSRPLSYKIQRDAEEPAKIEPVQEEPAKVTGGKPTQRPYTINGKTYYPLPSAEGFSQRGIASWYGKDFHGRKTSNGETYNMHAITAAHKTLPMNTQVLVRNFDNGKEMTVRVNDRGPFVKDRVIDLSFAAARQLGYAEAGTAIVEVIALGEAEVVVQGGVASEHFLPHQDLRKGVFFVQVGAFSNKDNANRLSAKLKSWGKQAHIREVELDGKVLYRVQVDAGETLAEAARTERVFENAGFESAFVIAQ